MNRIFNSRFQKKSPGNAVELVDRTLCRKIAKLVLHLLLDENDNLQAEDLISAAATIVGERCIDAADEISLRDHVYIPGSCVFSNKINELICGDIAAKSMNDVPRESVVGILRSNLNTQTYADEEFPILEDVFKYFAANFGNPATWGRVPLSVGQEHWPLIHPMRIGYETRPLIDKILDPIKEDKARCLRVTTESLAAILMIVAHVIDHKVALTMAIETINGMAKTAPMTEKMLKAAGRLH